MKQDEAPDLQQELQDLVTKTLVKDGLDVVVTSRPSGIVDASQYVDKFVIMNLLPLTSGQQRSIIKVQMKDNEFFDNLFATRWELELHAECMTISRISLHLSSSLHLSKPLANCDLICSDIRKNMDTKYDEILKPEEQRQIETLPAPAVSYTHLRAHET